MSLYITDAAGHSSLNPSHAIGSRGQRVRQTDRTLSRDYVLFATLSLKCSAYLSGAKLPLKIFPSHLAQPIPTDFPNQNHEMYPPSMAFTSLSLLTDAAVPRGLFFVLCHLIQVSVFPVAYNQ